MKRKFLFFATLGLMLVSCCLRPNNKCKVDANDVCTADSIESVPKLMLKYDSVLQYDMWMYRNLELQYGKICYHDTIHNFDFSWSWNRRGPEEVRVWSNGKRTDISIRLQSPIYSWLVLHYEGTNLMWAEERGDYYDFLNDIDSDGFCETGYYTYMSEEPIFIDDTIECDILGSQHVICKLGENGIAVDSALTERVTRLEYSIQKDSVILGKKVTLVAVQLIDLNDNILSQLESKE